MFVVRPGDDEEELKATVMEDMADIFSKVDKGGEGVCVQVRLLACAFVKRARQNLASGTCW